MQFDKLIELQQQKYSLWTKQPSEKTETKIKHLLLFVYSTLLNVIENANA